MTVRHRVVSQASGVTVERRGVAAGDVVLELALDVGEHRARADAEQVGLQPGAAELLLHQDQPVHRVLGGAQAAGRLEADA